MLARLLFLLALLLPFPAAAQETGVRSRARGRSKSAGR